MKQKFLVNILKSPIIKTIAAAGFSLAIFGLAASAYAVAPSLMSAKITGPNTVTVTYSQPVNTTSADYLVFTGVLYGRTVTALSGSGTSTITLTFSGNPFAIDANGGMSVANTVTSTADKTPFVANTYTVGDGQVPALISFIIGSSTNSPSSTMANIGDTATITFTVNKPITAPFVSIAGHPIGAIGNGSGPYVIPYTLTASDTAGVVPFTIDMTDVVGNKSTPIKGTLTFTGSLGSAAPAPAASSSMPAATTPSSPIIAQVTPVPAASHTTTPGYSFSSTAAGTINYSGDCSSSTKAAVAGNNNIIFNALADGQHFDCNFTVTDSSGRASNTIFIPAFTVTTGAPAPSTPPAEETAPVPSSDGFKFTRNFGMGTTNNDVLELQKRLTEEGVYTGSVTGKFGRQTFAAVKLFQKQNGLKQLGYVGPGTRALLNK